MRKTRQQDKVEFEYTIKELFDWDEDKDIVIVLRTLGYIKLSEILLLDDNILQNLRYTKYGKEYIQLVSNLFLIKFLQRFIVTKSASDNIDKDYYTKIDSDNFDYFQISHYIPTYIRPSPTTRVNPISTSSNSSSYLFTPISTFKKGIKRDSILFPKFKDSKFWDNFK